MTRMSSWFLWLRHCCLTILQFVRSRRAFAGIRASCNSLYIYQGPILQVHQEFRMQERQNVFPNHVPIDTGTCVCTTVDNIWRIVIEVKPTPYCSQYEEELSGYICRRPQLAEKSANPPTLITASRIRRIATSSDQAIIKKFGGRNDPAPNNYLPFGLCTPCPPASKPNSPCLPMSL